MALYLCSVLALVIPALAQLTPSPAYNPPAPTAGLVSSPSSPNAQWPNILGNALWFYDAQRSGNLNAGAYGNRVEWRNDSCLEDGSDEGIDLTGGWYDAGDYIKATHPLGYTMFALAWGALTHGAGYDQANQTAYLDGTLRWGFDWLMKAHPHDNDVLYIQVGSSEVDNSYWGGDQDIPTPRPAYQVNSSHPGTDVWASTAAAFALGALLYTPGLVYNSTSNSSVPTSPSLGNATYAATLRQHAQTLYDTAVSTAPCTTFSKSVPAAADAYRSSTYADDLAVAALALSMAMNESDYYMDAYVHYTNYSLSGTNEPWNWESRTPALYVLFAEAATARPGLAQEAGLDANLTGWKSETEGYFDRIIEESRAGNDDYYLTDGGLLFWRGDSDQASLQPAMATAFLMLKYAPMASTDARRDSYVAFGTKQLWYMLGGNPVNAVYLVGQHPNSPQSPHSAPASGKSGFANLRNDPPTNVRTLYGAMVGGPLPNDRYWDWRDDWVQNEVALDYSAVIPGLAAIQIAAGAPDPPYVQLQAGTYSIPSGQPCDDALPCDNGLSTGALAGIIVGAILGFVLILGLLWFWKRYAFATWWRNSYRALGRGARYK